jgi:hypothetical protein
LPLCHANSPLYCLHSTHYCFQSWTTLFFIQEMNLWTQKSKYSEQGLPSLNLPIYTPFHGPRHEYSLFFVLYKPVWVLLDLRFS